MEFRAAMVEESKGFRRAATTVGVAVMLSSGPCPISIVSDVNVIRVHNGHVTLRGGSRGSCESERAGCLSRSMSQAVGRDGTVVVRGQIAIIVGVVAFIISNNVKESVSRRGGFRCLCWDYK